MRYEFICGGQIIKELKTDKIGLFIIKQGIILNLDNKNYSIDTWEIIIKDEITTRIYLYEVGV